MTLELPTIELFNDKVGQVFTVETAGFPPVELTLTEAKPIKNYAKAAREPFSLIFTSKGVGVLPQRIYDLRNEALGLRPIFLVPIGVQGDVATYQAIFN